MEELPPIEMLDALFPLLFADFGAEGEAEDECDGPAIRLGDAA